MPSFLRRFVSGFQNVIYFYVRQLEMPKIAFQKCDVITITCFLSLQAKNKDIALNFFMRVVCMYLDHIYSVFYNLKFSDFIIGNN